MLGPINSSFHVNFSLNHLPVGTADFYNSKDFIQNESNFLSSQVSQDQQAQEKGLQQIKEAINGLT